MRVQHMTVCLGILMRACSSANEVRPRTSRLWATNMLLSSSRDCSCPQRSLETPRLSQAQLSREQLLLALH
jgi:hypothetical protein